MAEVGSNRSSLNTMPRVLVILAAYNGATWIDEQVRTILSQENVDVTLVVSDDCSKDGTSQKILKGFGVNPAVVLRTWDKPSGSAGSNFRRLFRSVDVGTHDYVALADQDDIWHVRKLATAVKALRTSGADGYSCATTAFWEDGTEQVLAQNPVGRTMDFLFEGAGQGCTFVITADLFRKVQNFCMRNEALSEQFHYHDWLIYLLARTWHRTWHFDQRPWMRYRQHANNEIGSKGSVASVLKRLELIRSGWYKRQIQVGTEICLREGADVKIQHFVKLFGASDSFMRRVRLSKAVLSAGRRRLSDRSVLVFSALMGWI